MSIPGVSGSSPVAPSQQPRTRSPPGPVNNNAAAEPTRQAAGVHRPATVATAPVVPAHGSRAVNIVA